METESEFTQTEQRLIQATKDTLRILGKVIQDKDIDAIITGTELEAAIPLVEAERVAKIIRDTNFLSNLRRAIPLETELDEAQLTKVSQQLYVTLKRADPTLDLNADDLRPVLQNLVALIQAAIMDNRITPDLPQLGPNEEAVIVGQLGAQIFAELLEQLQA